MLREEIVITQGYRTPIGNFNGSLARFSAADLGKIVLKKVLETSTIAPAEVSEVIMGQVLTAVCGQNPVRQAAINAGIPETVPAWLINQVCGSSLKSVILGFESIFCSRNNIVIAGGQESMSQSKHAAHIRTGVKMGQAHLLDTMISDGLTDSFSQVHMGITAENIAEKFNISRQEQDEFALLSQYKALNAQKKFSDEIVPITLSSRSGETIFNQDEFIKADISLDKLSLLKPAFKQDGTVTAGNASGINDGAAAVMIMKLSEARKRNIKPLVAIKSYAVSGVDPQIMGIAPVTASKNALAKAGWGVDELELIESNEAFAVQAIYVNKEMGWDINRVNVNGGAVALGHPIGASGARILVTLIYEMKRSRAKKGLATLCVGGGMGVAMCLENID
ncbi:MAG: acetyl-CoA C-acetyltransferase [Candidatus Midichloria sp.]|uniref:Acetyl-CoA acetyltransferase n=1 Tax=Hyalomma marginatum TaxID=34627 RepID=A0A8S4C2A8_9ACAR|nr:Acetyl-CoA acetyltransferase [Hyalomma marginatum]CAG7596284.1 Acetyl-CoA acetyltransferase [Hyalomma marginatum]